MNEIPDAMQAILPIILIFSFMGAISAFLISYQEYRKHFYDTRQPFRMALQTAFFAFFFFVFFSIFIGFLIKKSLLN